MPKCGSQPTQSVTQTGQSAIRLAESAMATARAQADNACREEACENGNCFFTETKIVGSTWSDATGKQWSSTQTSSGKCSCLHAKNHEQPCKREVEQTVTYYEKTEGKAGRLARDLARELGDRACRKGSCPDPKGVTERTRCIYKEVSILGTTWKDAASGLFISKQTSVGKCECASEWV